MDEERHSSRHGVEGGRGRLLRKFFFTFLVGFVLEVFLQGMRHQGRLERFEDVGADLLMSRFRNVVAPVGPTPPFVYVDADEQTYRNWDEPVLFPRARLAVLIDRALALAKPKLLVVDVDLSRSDPEGDKALADTMARYGAAGAGTPILLVRGLRVPSPERQEALPRLPASGFDPVVARSPNLHWAGASLRTTPDLVVRRWRFWQAVCEGGQPLALPSVPLASVGLLEGAGLSGVQGQLSHLAPASCAEPLGKASHAEIEIGGRKIEADAEGRILFSMPWHVAPGEARQIVALPDGRRVPLLTIVNAQRLEQAAEPPGRQSPFADAVVVIGGSYAEGLDLHLTPIGLMPGALILVNAIHTALGLPTAALVEAPIWAEGALSFVLIVLVAGVFTLTPIWAATLLSLAISAVVLLFAGYWSLPSGFWLDATLPVLAIMLHRWATLLEHAWEHRGPYIERVRSWKRRHG